MVPVSVVLVRTSTGLMTGGRCCTWAGVDGRALGDEDTWRRVRRQQEHFGILHRALREFFPADDAHPLPLVSVVVVEPRNQLYLLPKLWSDVLAYRPDWSEGWRTALQMFALPAVVVNGRVVSSGPDMISPDSLLHLVRKLLPAPRFP